MTDEPADYDPNAVTLEVGTRELRGEEVRTMDVQIRVPKLVLEEVRAATEARINRDLSHVDADDLPSGVPEPIDYSAEDYPDVFRDYLNERLRFEYVNLDLPDTAPE